MQKTRAVFLYYRERNNRVIVSTLTQKENRSFLDIEFILPLR